MSIPHAITAILSLIGIGMVAETSVQFGDIAPFGLLVLLTFAGIFFIFTLIWCLPRMFGCFIKG